MMTKLEAEERAEKIWGSTVRAVKPRGKWAPGEWVVETFNGHYHDLDGNGHAYCHDECAAVEAATA